MLVPPRVHHNSFLLRQEEEKCPLYASLSEGELPQFLFSQVRFIQVIKGRLDFIPKLHPHFDSCTRTAPILEAGNKGRLGIDIFFLEQLAPVEQQTVTTF